MLPDKTIKKLWSVYGALCSCGTLPYKTSKSEDTSTGSTLRHILPTDLKYSHFKIVFFATFFHTFFITYRFYQAWKMKSSKLFLLFVHFAWCVAFTMICWLYITLYRSRFDVMAYCNGLFKFYGSFISMPGERMSAKSSRKTQAKPCLVDILVTAFLVGAVLNTLITLQIFILYQQSYQFVYSVIPICWADKYPSLIILFVIYEMAMPGINWTLLLFFIIIHLVHLLCTRNYLLMLRRNTRKRILKPEELRHHYRSIQILHNHYNESIASYMPYEVFVLISLIFAGNIGTIRMIRHVNDSNTSILGISLLPMVSLLSGAFQIIFYQRAGDLHHLSSYFSGSVKKGLFTDKLAIMYLKSFPPLCVKVGNLVDIRRFTVVKFIGTVVVGTARLSLLFFRQN